MLPQMFRCGRGPLMLCAALFVLVLVACLQLTTGLLPVEGLVGSYGLLLVGMSFAVRDAKLAQTKALPNGAATTVSDGIDLELTSRSVLLADCEVLVEAPTLTTGELGDTQTITYHLQHDSDPAFGSAATLISTLIVQTGAGGAGAAAASKRVRLPSNTKRYIRLQQVKTGASNASAKSGTVRLVF